MSDEDKSVNQQLSYEKGRSLAQQTILLFPGLKRAEHVVLLLLTGAVLTTSAFLPTRMDGLSVFGRRLAHPG